MNIRHLGHKEINKSKWDETISSASNGNIYGYSWYLDVVCPGWEALVTNDYQWIMPLTGKRKFGISYLFRPMLSQQLGIFSISKPTTEEVEEFLYAIPSKYRLVHYCLNKSNNPPDTFHATFNKNYELDLSPEYEHLKSAYSDNHKRNIKKAARNGGQITEDIGKEDFFNLLVNDNSPGSRILSGKRNSEQLYSLLDTMFSHKSSRIIGLENRKGVLVSAVLFGRSHQTWYYLVPVNSGEGKEGRALFAIIDHLIRSQSGSHEFLDFEGSNIKGLAQFYSGFGAHETHYPEIRVNHLPWPIKYLK